MKLNKLFFILLLWCVTALADEPPAFREVNLVSREQVQLPEPTLNGSDYAKNALWYTVPQHPITLLMTSLPAYRITAV